MAEPVEGEEWEEEDEIPTHSSLSEQDSLDMTSPSSAVHNTPRVMDYKDGSHHDLKDMTTKPVSPNKSGQGIARSATGKTKGSHTHTTSSHCCKDSPISCMVSTSRRATSILKSRLLSGSNAFTATPNVALIKTCLQE